MAGDDLDLPDELYGFAGWLLWLVATRATRLVDEIYEFGLAHRSAKYGAVDGHVVVADGCRSSSSAISDR